MKKLTAYRHFYFKLTAMLLLPLMNISGQQIPNFSMYSMNHYVINPAASGLDDMLPVTLSYRKLWAGIELSPSVQYLSGNMKVHDDMGAGARIFNYQAGPLRKTGIEGTYSYHLSLGNGDTRLAFGLSMLLYQFKLNKSDLSVYDVDDQVFMGSEQMVVPDAGIGIYLYEDRYFAGLSIPQLFQRSIDLKSDVILQQKQVRHYYLHGGYRFYVNREFRLEPSVMLKFIESGIFQADINAMVTYRDMVNFGVSFRTSDAISFQVGYKADRIFAGYAWDMSVSGLHGNSFGSHELLFTYKLDNFLLR